MDNLRKLSGSPARIRNAGLSLAELLIAMAISSGLMLGLATTFKTSSDSQRALEKSSQLIENGRYAISLLYEDLRHAGYYGHYYMLGAPPTALPDPCETTSLTRLRDAMAMPVQVYKAASLTARPVITSTPTNTCDSALLDDSNLQPGSDILIVRRADTSIFTGSPNEGEVYLQANSRVANLMIGNPASDVPTDSADGLTANLKKYPGKASDTTIADTRKYRVHVYFIAPCSFGSGTGGVCAAGDDTIPTLKRLELGTDGSDTVMNIVPLVEGIEFMKLEYGIDNSPTAVNPLTGLEGDGTPDIYVSAPTVAQLPLVVSVRVHLLTRSPDETAGFADAKVYTLAGVTIPASNDAYKRHVFSTEVRSMNLGGRREIPQ
jgi:type IV pilus assembly protein PilW